MLPTRVLALAMMAPSLGPIAVAAKPGPAIPAPAYGPLLRPTVPRAKQCTSAASPWWLTLRGGAAPSSCPTPTGSLPLRDWHPVLLALLGTSFGWLMTALGSAAVVVHRLGLPDVTYRKVLDFMLGVSGGVMTAASYWSLLAPALEFAELQGWGDYSYVPVALGFLSGGVLLQATDWLLSRMQGSLEELDLYRGLAAPTVTFAKPARARSRSPSRAGSPAKKSAAASAPAGAEAARSTTKLRRLLMLIIAITIHNFPEGMAVGVAFGAIGSAPGATFGSAASLALGIGLQNFPVRAASPPRLAAPPRRPASPPRALTQRD